MKKRFTKSTMFLLGIVAIALFMGIGSMSNDASAMDIAKTAGTSVVMATAGLVIPKEEADKLIEQVKSAIQDKLDKKADSEKIEFLTKSLKDLESKQGELDLDKFKTTITDLEMKVKSLEENGGNEVKALSIRALLKENKDALSGLAEKANTGLTLKVPATMLVSSSVTGANAGLLPEIGYIQGLKTIAERTTTFFEIVNKFNTDNAQLTWSDEVNREGDAAFIAEGSLKPLADFEIQPKLSGAKEVAVLFKVGKNMLKDISYMESLINGKMRDRLLLKTDEKIFNGDATLSAGLEFDGITQYASAFVAGSLALTVTTPTTADAIRAVIAQISVQTDTDKRFSPDYAVMNPYDVAGMDLQKGTDGHYTLPPFSSADGRTVYGVKIIESTLVPAGQLLVGDFMKSNFGVYEDIEIDFGYEDKDFTKNLITFRASARYHHFISANEAVGFVYDSIATIKLAIAKI